LPPPVDEEIDGAEEVEIADEGTAEPEGAADPGEKKPEVIDPAEHRRLQAELKAEKANAKTERARAKEADIAARYWNEQAKAGGGRKEPAVEAEPEPDIDLVDVITKDGIKGLDRALAKLGYVKQSDVDSKIGATRAQIASESAVLSKYPDLADNNSPLFAKTAEIYNQLRQDPDMARSSRLMEIAARTASAELAKGGDTRSKRRGAPEPEDQVDDDFEGEESPEEARAARIARQSGDRGRRESRSDNAPEELSPLQKRLVQNLRNAGADITEAGYKQRALSGKISRSGTPTQRRAA
jgi:hypothetical protein